MMTKRSLPILLITLFVVTGHAQKLSKEGKKLFRSGEEAAAIGDYQTALNYYLQAYPMDSLNPYLNYKTGVAFFFLKNKRKDAFKYLKRAESGKYKDVYFLLGQLEHLKMNFDQALKYYDSYKRAVGESRFILRDVDRAISITLYAKEMIKRPMNVEIENLGEKVNSKYPDYVPLITADENMLVFTSRREGSSFNQRDPNGDFFEDIYVSFQRDGKWSSPVSIGTSVNTATHDACAALSPDGQQLITYRTSEDMLSGDLYLSTFNGKEWSSPTKLPENINSTEYVEASASIAADNDILYFSSDRPGGFGGKDIYFSRKLPDNTWGKPINAGSVVNTEYDEDAPFIHPDGKTLYFSSKGHNTVGGYDIFKTNLDEASNWSVPENLGFPINSVDDDIYFVLSIDGKNGYYSANRPNGLGDQDIYTIKNPEQYFKLTVVKGKVIDHDNKAPAAVKISLLNKTSNQIEGVFRSNRLTGAFVLVGYPGNDYDILIESVDYQSVVQSVKFPSKDISLELVRKEASK